jgi:hypothetical protein
MTVGTMMGGDTTTLSEPQEEVRLKTVTSGVKAGSISNILYT